MWLPILQIFKLLIGLGKGDKGTLISYEVSRCRKECKWFGGGGGKGFFIFCVCSLKIRDFENL